ncbi:PREDICTED: uncharacterized protein LOC109158406 [Ipomoea nil]|uniref:uncharacterized protein LOC109158406 n=1 Tax=Ipomoea nil TaxID=35883 RepID=UPI000900ED32|nr:PREDICTED: uncharacterized protein LOC109158406 [Ipomoea nil]
MRVNDPRKNTQCQKYTFVDPNTWKIYLERRKTAEFEESRKKHQEIQSKNVHPHHLARGGYKRLQKIMMDEKMKEQEEDASSDPSSIVSPPSPPARHEKWKRARMNKSGNINNEATRMVVEKIDFLSLQASQGEFVESGRQDILSSAIGTDEH